MNTSGLLIIREEKKIILN